MKTLITFILTLSTTAAFASTDSHLAQKIFELEEKIVETKDVKVKCSQWLDKLNCISYLQRFEKEFTFKAARYDLKKIVLDELESSTIHMNKEVRLSVYQNFNKQVYKLVPTIHKIDELKTLSRSYSKDFSFKVFCGASLTAQQCELGLFNFLKSKPKNFNQSKIKKLIITLEDKSLNEKGSLFMSHNNVNPQKYISKQAEDRLPAQQTVSMSH